ncbi:hypothetical protein ACLKA6_000358 [Drosophila palustris]
MMSVKYTLERNEAQCNGKRFIELVSELFPGLESIEPYGVIDCVHLKNFTRLRKLDLRHSWIRWSYREYNSEKIGDLKSLEELIIPDGWRFVETLLDKGIEELTFCESFGSVTIQTYKRLTNLRKLTIINEIKYPGEYLHEIISTLPRLEHLDVVDSPIFPSEIDLWNVVACCPSLKILNISSTDLGGDFFNISSSSMKKVLDKRSTPLTLLCHDTDNADQICLDFKHPNLNVLFERIEKYHIDWKALDEDDGFTSEALQELITALPQLERLDLVNFQFWKLETELWETVACCPSLKILNISSMPLYADFFHTRSRRPMERVLEMRSTPLTLHCPDTGEYEHLIHFYFKHRNLKLSFETLKINYIPCNSVEMHFLPFGTSTNSEEAC